jgi:hypothetical protein
MNCIIYSGRPARLNGISRSGGEVGLLPLEAFLTFRAFCNGEKRYSIIINKPLLSAVNLI